MISKLKDIIIKYVFRNVGSDRVSDIFIDKGFILNLLSPNPIIIDCGAHIGSDSIEFAKYPGSTIYAFEPVPEVYEHLINNTKKYPNITCFNLALSDYDGVAEMYISSGASDGSSSLLKPKTHLTDHPDVFFKEVITVKCNKIDTWAKENNVSKVDMLWLDMQGFEQKMLTASKEIFNSVQVIHTEVSKHESYEGIKSYKEFKSFFRKNGFKLIVEAIPKGSYGGNVLFVRNKKNK
ncbi:FkbM family methyltransferase [Aquiflexum sp. LQ15W]|uniref:FkbM family methyltransferase n=1 Tax=Cognataquiflexum nitidum TaxID=2922272 RepID=UPI001F12C80C|nr:FkbM family methyltransferase [Cognataquiflexum nitidum]MCH6201350.1 FkbM family methyltransferase [Cognataquiflexum nitidum]